MGEFVIGLRLRIVGWIATIIMGSSVIGMATAPCRDGLFEVEAGIELCALRALEK
jgi:hypothetical protein